MKEAQFQRLLEGIDNLNINFSQTINYLSLENMIKLSPSDLNVYTKKTEQYMSAGDGFISDLYHILGMANLSSSQTSTLIKRAKETLEKRATIKALWLVLQEMPKINQLYPNKDHVEKYRCHIVKDLILTGQIK